MVNLVKSYYNKYAKLKINNHSVWRKIKSIDDLNDLEYASKKSLKDLYELNKKFCKLEEVYYEYYYRAMCEFAIGLNKMKSLEIEDVTLCKFRESFNEIHNEFEELRQKNSMRDYVL